MDWALDTNYVAITYHYLELFNLAYHITYHYLELFNLA